MFSLWSAQRCSQLADSFHADVSGVCSSETSVITKATQRNIPEDVILHNYHREKFTSYIALLTGWGL
jgi:hypothetical protein